MKRKITESEVVEIRKEYAAGGASQSEIAERYDISRTQVSYIVNGDGWKHAGGPIKGEDYDNSKRPSEIATNHADRVRFWDKVDKGGPEECWEWTGATNSHGYGNLAIRGNYFGAHRVSYQIHKGDVGDELVLHHCDNPPCVNPDHLYLGDKRDNANDAVKRGGIPTVFTYDDIEDIRKRYDSGESDQSDLADEYGTSQPIISAIVLGKVWVNAPGPIQELALQRDYGRLTEEDVVEIRERYAAGDVTHSDIADDYGISTTYAGQIISGERRPDAPGPIAGEDYEPEPTMPSGERHHLTKFGEREVVEIRERYAEGGVTQSDLADEYGVNDVTISNVANGKTWPNAPGPIKGEDY